MNYDNEKIVIKNKIDYEVEDLKLPSSIIKSPLGNGIHLRSVMGETIKDEIDIFEKKEIKNFNQKLLDSIISPKAKRLGTSLTSANKLLKRLESIKSTEKQRDISLDKIEEIKEKEKEGKIKEIEYEELIDDLNKNLKIKKSPSTATERRKFFMRNKFDKNYYKKLNHAVLGSIAEVQLENKRNIENKIKEYVSEYNKQFEDMTFRKKDRKYEHSTQEYRDYLAQMREDVLNLNP